MRFNSLLHSGLYGAIVSTVAICVFELFLLLLLIIVVIVLLLLCFFIHICLQQFTPNEPYAPPSSATLLQIIVVGRVVNLQFCFACGKAYE